MLALLKVSFRNVGRNKRRSLITMLTVFLGVTVITATRGLLNGLQGEIRSALTRKMHGDLQIHHRGYQDSLESNPYKMLLPWDQGSALGERGMISAAAPRLRLMGLLNHQKSQTSTPVMINAIDSSRELAVCPRLQQALQQGSMLDSAAERFAPAATEDELGEAQSLEQKSLSSAAQAPAPKARGYHQLLLSPSLMRGLGAQLGDEIILLVQDRSQMQQALITQVVGVVDYGMIGAANRMAWVDFTSLQRITDTRDSASEIALALNPALDLEQARDHLQANLPAEQIVETYMEIGGFFRDVFALQNLVFSAILAIVFTIVVAAIVNTSLMTVMERTREIGALMALGYRRRHILSLFLGEAAVIGLAGGLSGVGVAVSVVSILSTRGIPFALPGQAIATTIYPTVSLSFILLVLLLALGAALISGLAPAYRASRLKPVTALAAP